MAERSTAYVFLIFLFLVLVLSLCIVNAVTYGRIASSNDTITELSPTGARVLMWINIIFAAIIAIYLVYYLVILITSETAKNAYAAINDKYSSFKQGTMDTYGRLRGLYGSSNMPVTSMVSPQQQQGMMMASPAMMSPGYGPTGLTQSPPSMNPF